MSLCINPSCPKPDAPTNPHNRFCQSCGTTLLLSNRYRVTRLLSDSSGFGTIYEADDAGTPKILKILKEHLNSHSKAVELFEKEAIVLSQLHHPGIPKVDGYFTVAPGNANAGGTPSELHCIVMEKIDGLNLEDWMQQRHNQPITQKQALKWLRQVVEILHLVHQQQYFHRDIKPPNIMRRENGLLALIDFGTAREVTTTYLVKVGGAQHRVTGVVSAGYTPQEQINGKAVPQSDFYALGRTFVYLLTGKEPTDFEEDSRTGQLLWRSSATQVEKPLADLIDDLMQPFPGNRPKNTDEILQRIDKTSRELDAPVPPPQPPQPPQSKRNLPQPPQPPPLRQQPSKRKRKWLVRGAVVLFAVVGGVQIYCQNVFNANPISLLISLSFLKTTLSGHSDSVYSAAFSPDGQTLASGSYDKTIKIWNVATGQEISTLRGHSSPVISVVFSPDGQTLASGSGDKTIKIWNVTTGQEISTLRGHFGWVYSAAFSPDGQTIASASFDKTIKIWNVTTGQEIRTLRGHSDSVFSVAFSPDGQTLASGSPDNTIKIWNVTTGQEISTLRGHSSSVGSVAFSPDGQTLASGSWDKTIKIWNVTTEQETSTLRGHSDWVRSVAFSPDGQTLASGSSDETIKLWRVPR